MASNGLKIAVVGGGLAGLAAAMKIAEAGHNVETIKRSVEVGFGLAIVPHPSVMDEERNNQLVVIELAEKDWIRPVGVVYRTDRTLSIAANKFVQLLENKPQNS